MAIRSEWIVFGILVMCSFVILVSTGITAETETIITGRVAHIDGDLFRYVNQKKDWIGMVKDTPFHVEDIFISGNSSMAEMAIVNGTWIRLGENTQVQVVSTARDLSQIDMPAGIARFYSKDPQTIVKVTSKVGSAIGFPGSVFDYYVGDNSLELIGLKGRVVFIHAKTGVRYETTDAMLSLTANQHDVSLKKERPDPEWDKRNKTRERFWNVKSRIKGKTFRNLPVKLRAESYVLEENGKWDSVEFDGSLHWVWRPTKVFAGWSPFTRGRWTNWKGDHVWIPSEPFGYLTHHYGSWILLRNRWYWLPPSDETQGKNARNITAVWHPGRVRWIHNSKYIGWIPLAPYEMAYTVFKWGGFLNTSIPEKLKKHSESIMSCRHARNAIIILKERLHKVNSYKNTRLTKTDLKSVTKSYVAAVTLESALFDDSESIEQYSPSNRNVRNKPHYLALVRAETDKYPIRNIKSVSAAAVKEEVAGMKQQKTASTTYIEKPRTTSYIVASADVNRPRREVKLELKEIRKPAIRFELIPDVARSSINSSLTARQRDPTIINTPRNKNVEQESISGTSVARSSETPRESGRDNFEQDIGATDGT